MSALDQFSPLTHRWFTETYGNPTPPQAQGWLPIQRGEHTLILAPTGSGKTLAAFLWGIDELFRTLPQVLAEPPQAPPPDKPVGKKKRAHPAKGARPAKPSPAESEGIHLLYISPLKALNNDVERNLRVPLEGIREAAACEKIHLPHIRVAVRTGDTPAKTRADMLKHPPHILITTPESVYLMLTSPRARELFRTTRTVIVDEIHTLAGNKRGVHLALSIERLQKLALQPIQRIGLSATIKPLDEVAHFLGGQSVSVVDSNNQQSAIQNQQSPAPVPHPSSLIPRAVTIVDARYKKPLDLEIVTVTEDFRNLPGESIWATVVPNVLNDIRQHDTTLIFANNRRLAERTADRLNAQLEAELSEEIPPGSPEALAPGGKMRDRGIFAIGAQGPIRAHHGSMSKEARHEMEEDLKAGKLPALVGTSSLELGIDIGAVDLVVQLQSPKSVSQGLQRVGRSGHLVGQTSHGKIYPTFREDLAEAAAIARGMFEGDVEPTHTPQNALDVLAQQIVACVAMEDWDVQALYELVRGAYPYEDLTFATYVSVLEMLSGKYFLDAPGARAVSALRPKISWDRVHNRLSALPGSRLLALSNVGTIPDTGQYKVYLADNKTRIGELDEEFVLETRVGDTFLLGSQVWRALEINDDRVIVGDAAGSVPRMPFWRGDAPWRPFTLGERIGKFRRQVQERIERNDPAIEKDLSREYALDANSSHALLDYVQSQIHSLGAISSDQTIIVESFQNAVGDPFIVIHSPFGGRVNAAWAVALTSLLRERAGITPEVMTNDDGIIMRLVSTDEGTNRAENISLQLVTSLTADQARERILAELPGSAVFGAQFRMNAARALLLTKPRAGKRTPFWMQRLRAKDLLAYVSRFPDFPILIETYRDVLSDVFDLPHLETVLDRIHAGEIRIITHEALVPSQVAAGLLFNFVSTYLYEWDAPKAERSLQLLSVPRTALQDVMQGVDWSELLKPEAVTEVVSRVQHLAPGYQARTADELALVLREMGDLATPEILARSSGDGSTWLAELAAAGRVQEIKVPTADGIEKRWLNTELSDQYAAAFASDSSNPTQEKARFEVLSRWLRSAGPVTHTQILERYALDSAWLDPQLNALVNLRELVAGHFTTRSADQWIEAQVLEQIHRRTLNLLRAQVQPVALSTYADFLARWQHAHPAAQFRGETAVAEILKQLRGVAIPGTVWERDVLPARVADYNPLELEELFNAGEWVWVAEGNDPKRMRVRFIGRGEGSLFLDAPNLEELTGTAQTAYNFLKDEGASFATDIQSATKLSGEALANALIELTLRGLVTNDEIETLRNLVEHGGIVRAALPAAEPQHRTESAFGAELQARLGPRPPKMTQYRQMKQRTQARIARSIAAQASPWRGRWTLVHRSSILGTQLSTEERAEKRARALLERYGIITREVLEHEEIPELNAVYSAWQRMEWRGNARRGVFVAGMTGLQYALPEAVEQLRAVEQQTQTPPSALTINGAVTASTYILNATDPANLWGGESSTLRVARVPSTYLVLEHGAPVLIMQENGARISTTADATELQVQAALREFFTRPEAPRHAQVFEWNGDPILGTNGETLLQTLGFYRMPKGMERWTRP